MSFLCLFLAAHLFAKTVLVVGGAGYIGSYVNKRPHEAGYHTIILDNLSTGNQQSTLPGQFVKGDIHDRTLLDSLLQNHAIDAVVHFAAHV